MMSTLSSSVYQRHLDHGQPTYKKRGPMIGAPYVLCLFVVGVILMGVGTFVTTHAYEHDPPNNVMVAIGITLLALGGLLLLGSVVMCTVACCRNRHLHHAMSDDLFSIGGSTFYGGRNFVRQDDEIRLHVPQPHHLHNAVVGGVVNPGGPAFDDHHSEAVRYLAETVAEERHRRQNSRKYMRGTSDSPGLRDHAPLYHTSSHGFTREDEALREHLGLERLRRADPHLELAETFGLDDGYEDYDTGPRERAYSMSVRSPAGSLAPIPQRLRRNVTFSPASRARIQQQQQMILQQQQMKQHLEVPLDHAVPERKRSSKRRKARSKEGDGAPVKVHPLPQYNPDILSALGLQQNRVPYQRGFSAENPRSGSLKMRIKDPDVTHGSLGKPQRRPSMGVKTLSISSSGSAYRHRSSIYASDMELHRSPRGLGGSVAKNEANMPTGGDSVASSISNVGREPFLPGDRQEDAMYRSASSNAGSVSDFRRIDSSPLLSLPDPAEESLTPVPSHHHSGGYSPHARHHRPLSHISSCCSECCDCGDDSCGGVECGGNGGNEKDGNEADSGGDTSADERPRSEGGNSSRSRREESE